MRKFVSLGLIAALFLSILSGCAAQSGGVREHQGAAVGAGAGAVGGAVVGGLLGGKRGAVAGGLLTAAVLAIVSRFGASRRTTRQKHRKA